MPTEREPELPADLRARVLELASRHPSPTRDKVRRRTVAWLLAGALVPLALFVAIGGVEQGPRPSLLVALTASGSLGVALIALGAALGYGGRILGPSRARLLAIVVFLPVLLMLWKLGCSTTFADMTATWPTRPGLRCFGFSLLLGLAPLGAFLAARRGSDPVHPITFGAALGAAGGLWAAALIDLWCPVGHPLHVMLGHALPAWALAVLGAIAVARVLPPQGMNDER